MEEFLTFLENNWLSLFILIPIFIQISPIKVNPLKWIGKHLFEDMNKENTKRQEEIKKEIKDINNELKEELIKTTEKINELSKVVDENEIDRVRWEILDFSNSLQNNHKHTKDEFLHIIQLNDKYHKILEKRHLTNGVLDMEYMFIEQKYKECLINNSFLQNRL